MVSVIDMTPILTSFLSKSIYVTEVTFQHLPLIGTAKSSESSSGVIVDKKHLGQLVMLKTAQR